MGVAVEASTLARVLPRLGARFLLLAGDVGGMALTLARTLQHLVPPRFDRAEFMRAMLAFGSGSLPVIIATAVFTGMIMVLQAAVYVEQFGVYNLVGWYTGFATLREVAPLLVGLMFSGRVGAGNTSELAAMQITEQLDALRILALDVYELFIAPRALAMVITHVALVVFADGVAIASGALCARWLLGLDARLFWMSLSEGLGPRDFLTGLGKAGVYGAVIATVSSYSGMQASGGSPGVGRAVNRQVVACAVALFIADYLLTSAFR